MLAGIFRGKSALCLMAYGCEGHLDPMAPKQQHSLPLCYCTHGLSHAEGSLHIQTGRCPPRGAMRSRLI